MEYIPDYSVSRGEDRKSAMIIELGEGQPVIRLNMQRELSFIL